MIRTHGEETGKLRSDLPMLQRRAQNRRCDPGGHRSHRGGQAKDLRRHGSRGESHARTGQPPRVDLLEKKFQEALKKAKETPDTGKPIRDFDLD
jgi:hypothetical protein